MGIGNSCDNVYQNKWQWKTLSVVNRIIQLKKNICVCVWSEREWERSKRAAWQTVHVCTDIEECIPSNTRTERNRKASCNMKIPSFFVVFIYLENLKALFSSNVLIFSFCIISSKRFSLLPQSVSSVNELNMNGKWLSWWNWIFLFFYLNNIHACKWILNFKKCTHIEFCKKISQFNSFIKNNWCIVRGRLSNGRLLDLNFENVSFEWCQPKNESIF